jgi:ribosomal protein S18 acetylase RimI-like enzyme
MAIELNVRYPDTDQNHHTVIERMSLHDIEQAAGSMLQTLVEANTAEFEHPWAAQPLPPGTIARHYRPQDQAGVAKFRDNMLSSVEDRGSQYLCITELGGPYRQNHPVVPGFIKITPSKGNVWQKIGAQRPNLYVDDVVVHPAVQRQRLGTALLHAGLKYTGFDQSRVAMLEDYDGQPASGWLQSIGFIANGGVVSYPVKFDGHRMAQTQREVPAIANAVTNLELRHRWLQNAVV